MLNFSVTARALATTYALAAGTGTIAGIIILRKQYAGVFVAFRKKLAKLIAGAAWPMALTATMGAFMLNVDIIMLGFFKTASDVGFYSAGQKIVQLLYAFPALFATALFPAISRFIGSGDKDKTQRLMEYGITTVLLIAIPIAVGGAILNKSIIEFVYGKEYLAAAPAFLILVFTILLAFPGSIIGNYILAYDQQKKAAILTGLGSLGNIGLNFLLIPHFGITGSAIATLISQGLYNGLLWRLAKKINNFFILKHLKKIAFATLMMGASALILNSLGVHVLINIISAVLVYFAVLRLFREKTLLELKSILKQ
jgi:O-antigen/teichoic acid export membrane protein